MAHVPIEFVFSPDAWYWASLPRREREMSIMRPADGGGVEWEFTVVERLYAQPRVAGLDVLIPTIPQQSPDRVLGLQVCVFEDGWQAYAEIAEFFAELAALNERIRAAHGGTFPSGDGTVALEEVRDLCARLGYVDATPRTRPGDAEESR